MLEVTYYKNNINFISSQIKNLNKSLKFILKVRSQYLTNTQDLYVLSILSYEVFLSINKRALG